MTLPGEALHRAGTWPPAGRIRAVLCDRDGTLVVDHPYNGDPARVVPLSGVRSGLDRLRANGLAVAMITNQSAIGRGWLRREQVDSVNAQVARLVGPFDVILVCPHTDDDRCACRKPAGQMVLDVACLLGVDAAECVVIGDSSTDREAAARAGAAAIVLDEDAASFEEATTLILEWS